MASELIALSIDALDPAAQARFWGTLLGSGTATNPTIVPPTDAHGFELRFQPTTVAKSSRSRMHLDLTSSSLEDQQATVERALALGSRHLDVGQTGDEGHIVLADPEGNEFCVIEPDNAFLAGCGRIGALACDGTQAVGYFWSEVLGWPLVWDQDEETAIQSPHGGPKISWGGPPVAAKSDKNRLHLDLAPTSGEVAFEVERLLGLGARHVDIGQGDVGWVVLADPDGNEFCVEPR